MKNLIKLFSFGLILCFALACARIGSPPGGEKDVEAPKVISSKPANYSTNYAQNKVKITFDEFVVLDNVFNEFIISPPLEKKPTPQTRGKSIVVEIPASKLDSVTYTLDFGQSIKDNNEGNPLPSYQFVISKTNYIDSCAISGRLVDDFTLLPNKDPFLVFLYKNLSDTSPIKTIPTYLGRTNPMGDFSINHISPGTYKVFALKDANNNMKYDLPTESISFLDKPISITPDSFPKIVKPEVDTVADSLQVVDSLPHSVKKYYVENDTASRDDSTRFKLFGFAVNLYSFLPEEPFEQYLKDYSRTTPEKFTLLFHENLKSPIIPRLLKPEFNGTWYLLESNPGMDTLNYWLTDSLLIKHDSLLIEITYPFTDTTKTLITKTDTLLLKGGKIIEKENKRGSRFAENLLKLDKKDEVERTDTLPKPPPRMQFSSNIKTANHDLNAPIWLTTSAPVLDFNPELVFLTRMEDTIEKPAKFDFSKDTSNFRKFRIDIAFEPSTTYHLTLCEGVFKDIYSRTIDTTKITFVTQSDDYYGIVIIKMTHINSQIIVQLLDKEETKIIRQTIISGDQPVEFNYLVPGTYKYKIIFDTNLNGKWDSGDYIEKRQPEKVLYFPEEIEIKSNWKTEYEWEILD